MPGIKTARSEFGVEIMRTFDGGRWLWNESQSWLEYIPAGKVMPPVVKTLAPLQNKLHEAVMTCCDCEAARVYQLRELQGAD